MFTVGIKRDRCHEIGQRLFPQNYHTTFLMISGEIETT